MKASLLEAQGDYDHPVYGYCLNVGSEGYITVPDGDEPPEAMRRAAADGLPRYSVLLGDRRYEAVQAEPFVMGMAQLSREPGPHQAAAFAGVMAICADEAHARGDEKFYLTELGKQMQALPEDVREAAAVLLTEHIERMT